MDPSTHVVGRPAPRGFSMSARIGWYTGPRRPDGCREWSGVRSRHDYGFIYDPTTGRQTNVIRLILGLKRGDGLVGRHTCDHRWCVEPSHLLKGTHQDNMRDASERNRFARGARQGSAVLTEDIVREIRRLRAAGLTLRSVAETVGKNYNTVASVLSGRRHWRHIT